MSNSTTLFCVSVAPPASRPSPRPPVGGGPGGIDLSAITAVKLKKVGVPSEDRQKVTESEKIYDEDAGVKSAFAKFQQKGNVFGVDIGMWKEQLSSEFLIYT